MFKFIVLSLLSAIGIANVALATSTYFGLAGIATYAVTGAIALAYVFGLVLPVMGLVATGSAVASLGAGASGSKAS